MVRTAPHIPPNFASRDLLGDIPPIAIKPRAHGANRDDPRAISIGIGISPPVASEANANADDEPTRAMSILSRWEASRPRSECKEMTSLATYLQCSTSRHISTGLRGSYLLGGNAAVQSHLHTAEMTVRTLQMIRAPDPNALSNWRDYANYANRDWTPSRHLSTLAPGGIAMSIGIDSSAEMTSSISLASPPNSDCKFML